jgi:hypothetical protein
MLTQPQGNYFTAQRLSQESQCKGLPGEPCTKKIEADRILWSLNKRLSLPELCSSCSLQRKSLSRRPS